MLYFAYLILFTHSLITENLLNHSWDYVAKQLTNGSLPEGRLTYDNVNQIMDSMNMSVVTKQEIGKTYQNQSIFAYCVGEQNNPNKPALLITSLHHAREMASLQNIMGSAKWQPILRAPFINNQFVVNATLQIGKRIIPFVNLDGFLENQKLIEEQHILQPQVRKNLNYTIKCNRYNEYPGVDLNRNYDFKFGTDNIGSSDDPCSEVYRGDHAFSELETQAIKHLIESNDFRLALNLHCFGDLWIIPGSYNKSDYLQNSIYEDYKLHTRFPEYSIIGSPEQTVQYSVNGEASDWMLSQNIITISPELGKELNKNVFTANFYPTKEQTQDLFEYEQEPLIKFIQYLPFHPIIEVYEKLQISQYNFIQLKKLSILYYVEIFNKGVVESNEKHILSFKSKDIVIEQVYQKISNTDQGFNITNITNISKEQFESEFKEMSLIGNQISLSNISGRQLMQLFIIVNQEQDSSFLAKNNFKKQINIHYQQILLASNPNNNSEQIQEIESVNITIWILLLLCMILVLLFIILFCKRRNQKKLEYEQKQLFKENIQNIYKAEQEF